MTRLLARNRFAQPRTPTEIVDGVWLLGSYRVNFYATVDVARSRWSTPACMGTSVICINGSPQRTGPHKTSMR